MKYEDSFVNNLVGFYRSILKDLRGLQLTKLDDNITHQVIVPYASYSPWYDDEKFMEVYGKIKAHTLVDIYRCYELWSFIKRNVFLKGDVLEVGVWRGGTGSLIAKACELFSDNKVYLVDGFGGVVKASSPDTIYRGGEHADTNVKVVEELLESLAISNTTLLKGVFPEQVNLEEIGPGIRLKLCHIDVDTYQSASDIFDYAWPRMTKGGAVIFDDYGFWGCEGITKLCNAFAREDAVFFHNVNGHAILVKV